jgi:hypothetical protein
MPTATAVPPRPRSDLVLRPLGDGGEFVVKGPSTGAYFSLGEQEGFLLLRLDGRRSVAAILVTGTKKGVRFLSYGLEVVRARLRGERLPLPLAAAPNTS